MDIKPFQYKASKVCTRCIIDDTVHGITFDEQGVCPFCRIHDAIEKKYSLNEESEVRFNELVKKIKKAGQGKKMIA